MIIGFKEWLDVCAHLGGGTTSLLLRKGGIHEGREGFSFKHEEFFLFPTGFHQAAASLTAAAPENDLVAASEDAGVTIRHFCVASFARLIRDRATIEALAPFHFWAPGVVWDRYNYSDKLEADCLSVAFVRVYQLPRPWHFPYRPNFGGCRSWVELPEPPANWRESMTPVIPDAEHASRGQILGDLLG